MGDDGFCLFPLLPASGRLAGGQNRAPRFYLSNLLGLGIIAAIYGDWWVYYLLLHFLLTRITKIILTLGFDFLPHHPHQARGLDAPYQATSNRIGFEWLMTPLFIFQNYHLVHHLYPTAPLTAI